MPDGLGFALDEMSASAREIREMPLLLIVLLVVLLLGAVPAWPYSRGWGYYPSGLLGLVLIVLIVLAVTGRL